MFGNHDDFVKEYLEPATVAAATRTGKLFQLKPATAGKLIVYRLHNQRLALPSSRQTFYELRPFVPAQGPRPQLELCLGLVSQAAFPTHSSLPFASQSSRCEKSPLTGNAFELIDTAILKMDSGARDQILHCSGNEHITRLGLRHDPRADVDGDAADIVAHQFAFAGVHTRAHIDPELFHCVARSPARNGPRAPGRRKSQENRRRWCSFPSAKARQFLSHNRVIRIEDIRQASVTERRGALSGGSDVEKQHRRQDAIVGIDRPFAGDEFLDVGEDDFHVVEHQRSDCYRDIP